MKLSIALVMAIFMSLFITIPAQAAQDHTPKFSFNQNQFKNTYTTRLFNNSKKSHITENGFASITDKAGVERCPKNKVQLWRVTSKGNIAVGKVRKINCRGVAHWANAPKHKNYFITVTVLDSHPNDTAFYKFVGEVWHSGSTMP